MMASEEDRHHPVVPPRFRSTDLPPKGWPADRVSVVNLQGSSLLPGAQLFSSAAIGKMELVCSQADLLARTAMEGGMVLAEAVTEGPAVRPPVRITQVGVYPPPASIRLFILWDTTHPTNEPMAVDGDDSDGNHTDDEDNIDDHAARVTNQVATMYNLFRLGHDGMHEAQTNPAQGADNGPPPRKRQKPNPPSGQIGAWKIRPPLSISALVEHSTAKDGDGDADEDDGAGHSDHHTITVDDIRALSLLCAKDVPSCAPEQRLANYIYQDENGQKFFRPPEAVVEKHVIARLAFACEQEFCAGILDDSALPTYTLRVAARDPIKIPIVSGITHTIEQMRKIVDGMPGAIGAEFHARMGDAWSIEQACAIITKSEKAHRDLIGQAIDHPEKLLGVTRPVRNIFTDTETIADHVKQGCVHCARLGKIKWEKKMVSNDLFELALLPLVRALQNGGQLHHDAALCAITMCQLVFTLFFHFTWTGGVFFVGPHSAGKTFRLLQMGKLVSVMAMCSSETAASLSTGFTARSEKHLRSILTNMFHGTIALNPDAPFQRGGDSHSGLQLARDATASEGGMVYMWCNKTDDKGRQPGATSVVNGRQMLGASNDEPTGPAGARIMTVHCSAATFSDASINRLGACSQREIDDQRECEFRAARHMGGMQTFQEQAVLNDMTEKRSGLNIDVVWMVLTMMSQAICTFAGKRLDPRKAKMTAAMAAALHAKSLETLLARTDVPEVAALSALQRHLVRHAAADGALAVVAVLTALPEIAHDAQSMISDVVAVVRTNSTVYTTPALFLSADKKHRLTDADEDAHDCILPRVFIRGDREFVMTDLESSTAVGTIVDQFGVNQQYDAVKSTLTKKQHFGNITPSPGARPVKIVSLDSYGLGCTPEEKKVLLGVAKAIKEGLADARAKVPNIASQDVVLAGTVRNVAEKTYLKVPKQLAKHILRDGDLPNSLGIHPGGHNTLWGKPWQRILHRTLFCHECRNFLGTVFSFPARVADELRKKLADGDVVQNQLWVEEDELKRFVDTSERLEEDNIAPITPAVLNEVKVHIRPWDNGSRVLANMHVGVPTDAVVLYKQWDDTLFPKPDTNKEQEAEKWPALPTTAQAIARNVVANAHWADAMSLTKYLLILGGLKPGARGGTDGLHALDPLLFPTGHEQLMYKLRTGKTAPPDETYVFSLTKNAPLPEPNKSVTTHLVLFNCQALLRANTHRLPFHLALEKVPVLAAFMKTWGKQSRELQRAYAAMSVKECDWEHIRTHGYEPPDLKTEAGLKTSVYYKA